MARIRKAPFVHGQHLLFRDAAEADAAFIHALRRDPVRARFLSAVPPDVEAQLAWLRGYATDDSQAYFVIEAAGGGRLGTVRLYDAQGESFSWGSWLLKAGLPSRHAIESALMVYHYGRWLGFKGAHFEVRRGNTSVRRFHENFGASRVGERDDHLQYRLAPSALDGALRRYQRFLPQGIRVADQ